MTKYIFFPIFLLVPCLLFAQIPGGSLLWLQADNGVIQTAGKVSQWTDRSGKGNSVLQSQSGSQPQLLANSLNGHSIVKFHGWNEYLVGPHVFPCYKDYTVTAVVRIDNLQAVNNILSGEDHAFYLAGDQYPRVVHGVFLSQLISSIPLDTNFAIVTVRYSEWNEQAKIYVNGQSGDSLYVTSNNDSAIYIGAFRSSYGLNGAIAELILYDRQLTEQEREELESSLRMKYAIPMGPLPPKPDSTFTSIPAQLQLYPREKNDSAVVAIEGSIYKPGYDSVSVTGFRNGSLFYQRSQQLLYSDGKAPFTFLPSIHAELSEYHFVVHLLNTVQDTVIADRDSITCGDVYLIEGESNSVFGDYTDTLRNEFCRTFGLNLSHNIRDTAWTLAQAELWGHGPSVGGWGLLLQKRLAETYHIPICIINGGVSGTVLKFHLRDSANPTNLETIYGRLLYRALKSKVARAAKAIFWYHAELDYVNYYYAMFRSLYSTWLEDFPNLQKCYIMQLRPAYCVDRGDQPLRELLRTIQDSLPAFESVSTTMFPHHDGCHFHDDGFSGIADQVFPLVARDFYHSQDTIGIVSPSIVKAFYTTSGNTEIAMVFSPFNSSMSTTADTIVGGITATIKDYFYPNDEIGKIESIRFSGDTVFLKLYESSNATFITYLPDRYYNGSDSVIYEGPWIKSERGVGAFVFYHFPIDSWKSDTNSPVKPGSLSLEAVPNPAINNTVIRYYLPEQEQLTLEIYDVLGKKLITLFEGKATQGFHDVTLATELLPAGEYFCKLQAGNTELLRKIILAK
ncbi:MAG: T9SS type A sorting domain-containing protein [Bacteroidota bacterium]|nr:T9SS type A sorting domain-containing protein [Bacteroidota bacterium]MDP4230499.1 T9SS type A sorting domain-containing protein [Bacteroidota bacterium]MDP4235727.1 T9SS type A sorting domain-containing protein [Bacteroidota bacterium]